MTTETEDKLEDARKQAHAQLDSIKEMLARLDHARDCDEGEDCELTNEDIVSGTGYYYTGQEVDEAMRDEYHDEDKARQRIDEDALSVETRSGWRSPGLQARRDQLGHPNTDDADEEYRILLCTGGPAVQIIGELSEQGEPDSARLMCQDWFTLWEEVIVTGEDHDALIAYASQFLGF